MSATAGLVDLGALIEASFDLEPLPMSVTRLAALVAADADLDEIIEVVEYDQALAGDVLRMANAAASGPREPIVTARQAVVRLGRARLLASAIGATVGPRLGGAVPEYGLDEGSLWRHSMAAAVAAELLHDRSRQVPAEALSAALLHDVGKLVMARFLSPEILALLDAARAAGCSELDAEREILDVHHGELGGLIAQAWDLPEGIAVGITYHHTPAAAADAVAYATHLADVLAHRMTGATAEPGEPDGEPAGGAEPVAGTLEALALTPALVDDVVAHGLARFDELMGHYR